MHRFLLILSLLLFLGLEALFAQTKVITGKVIGDDGEPIPGASVVIKGTNTGVVTDLDGVYNLQVPADATAIQISFLGMKTQELAIGDKTNLNATLESDAVDIEEVVVVGYGTVKKKDVTSSISTVKGGEIANLVSPSFDTQLAGRAAGVQVTQPNGVLGSSPTIRIRGVNSISSGTEPLYIVDGVPVSSGNSGMLYAKSNALGDINPTDIESFEVLKDGAATAIYGSRASNGVVLITTKKGKKGAATFNYDSYIGWSQASKLPDLLNADQFIEISNEKYANAGGSSPARAGENNQNTDWTKEVFRTGFQQNHNISASGGTEKTNYFFSIGYTNQEGITVGNDLERFSLRTNIDVQFTKWAKLNLNVSGSKQEINGLVEGVSSLSDVMFSTVRMLPNVAVYNPNDPTGYNIDASNRKALGRGNNIQTIDNGLTNIMWLLNNNINRSTSYRSLASTNLELKLIDELRFKTQLGADLQIVEDYMKWSPESGDGSTYRGIVEQVFTPSTRWNWQNILSYNKSLGENNFDLTAVQEYTDYSYHYVDGSVSKISDPAFMDNIITGTYATQEVNGGIQGNGLASYLFRANYNYASKYYIGGSVRKDGSSKLPEDERWGTFYGLSGAYRISNEDFWKNMTGLSAIINDLRLRASYATVGNQNINGNYPYLGTYKAYKYGGQTGTAFNNTGNPDLKWETQKITDIGFDMGLLSNRFTLTVAYWQKDNSDIVLDAPTAPSYGVPGNK
ncbi:MAG: SusC/RagA family TonB-linked outer membrane protein, partial [Paludibacter sp.]|nr:SusC/RagA family TonB-linked outer membrane protein [Paludibacter sp.]